MIGLCATHLTVRKGSNTVLANATLSCELGEGLVVLGENGSGKSVLLRSLALSELGALGRLDVLGVRYELTGVPAEEGPWPDLSIVLQSLALWPHLSAGDNVLMPWKRRLPEKRLTREALTELFAVLEIGELVHRYPAELSGGQRQRVAIARAIALRPRVLLLDEPSASLDARHAAALLKVLRRLKEEGTAIVCVTHNLGFAAKLADKYVFIHEGRLVDTGTWESVTKSTSSVVQGYLGLNSLQ